MDNIQPLDVIVLKNADEFDFIRKITTAAIALLLIALSWYVYEIFSGGIALYGPGEIVLEQDAKFDDLLQLDQFSYLTGKGVAVCIVDSGIDSSHPDLAEMNLKGWSDFIDDKNQPYDDQGHGTMMAGILVADGGLRGITPNVDLYVAKAMKKNGTGEDAVVATAIDWCIEKNVDIISLSLGGAQGTFDAFLGGDAVEQAVDDAYDAGIVVIAAAGNDGENDDGDVASPGSVESVICVGGVQSNGALWKGSSIGDNNGRIWPILLPRNDPDKKPEIVGPARDVPVIMLGGSWGLADGTSAATVYVTGAVALMLENNPDLKNGDSGMIDDLKEWIVSTSKPKENQDGHDDHYGYGLLQMTELINVSSA
ncbi:MAG TPA: hypothetical protein EYQ53_01090 [Candidatus Poseidoniales archaeon]|jgi:subtilisin family serine protease|nr:hypothetical protein [Candidatus Poseidoniales archaeon]HIL64928.1 hypothetical protein [Candidatus Poseidoniales archaeon]